MSTRMEKESAWFPALFAEKKVPFCRGAKREKGSLEVCFSDGKGRKMKSSVSGGGGQRKKSLNVDIFVEGKGGGKKKKGKFWTRNGAVPKGRTQRTNRKKSEKRSSGWRKRKKTWNLVDPKKVVESFQYEGGDGKKEIKLQMKRGGVRCGMRRWRLLLDTKGSRFSSGRRRKKKGGHAQLLKNVNGRKLATLMLNTEKRRGEGRGEGEWPLIQGATSVGGGGKGGGGVWFVWRRADLRPFEILKREKGGEKILAQLYLAAVL